MEIPNCSETPVCSQNVCSQFLRPLTPPPPPNQQSDGFPLEFLLEGPQTELRTLSQNCEQTLLKLREQTELFEQTGVSENCSENSWEGFG